MRKKITVMGLGLHGGAVGTIRWLYKQGARITVTDLKKEGALANSVAALDDLAGITFVLGEHREEDFINCDMVVRNPAVPKNSEYLRAAWKAGVSVEMDSSLFWQFCPTKDIIGVTGSKGKTTASRAIASLLAGGGKKIVLVGVDGVSPLAELKNITPETTVVFELSSWRLEALDERKISPPMAVVTSLYRDHLNTYNSFEDYAETKKTIIKYQSENDVAILNHDDELLREWKQDIKGKLRWYDVSTASDYEILGSWPEHMARNVVPAILIAGMRGIEPSKIAAALKNITWPPHRLEEVRRAGGVTYVNDSAATIPEATIAAIKSWRKNNIVLILGGGDKNLEYRELIKVIGQSNIRAIIFLPGGATVRMFDEIRGRVGMELPMYKVEDMNEAVEQAADLAKRGDVVLLSPAATSFGLFKHEFDRGDKFKAHVDKLKSR
ncbi:MAG: UDP-N-acetylmuramoyl-L-alanine--D-glutamate ligase [bacterium]